MSTVIFSLMVYSLLKVEGSGGLESTWRSSFPPTCFLFVPPLVLEEDLSYWLVFDHAYFSFLTMMNWPCTEFSLHISGWISVAWCELIQFRSPSILIGIATFRTLPNRGENWSHRKYNLSRKTGPKVHKSAPSVPNIWSNMSNFLALNLNFPPLQYGGFWPTRKNKRSYN